MVETLETNLASNVLERNCSTPAGITQKNGLSTGLYWTNYEETPETILGANTLHDTVGICYQNVVVSDNDTSPADRHLIDDTVNNSYIGGQSYK